MFPSRRLQPSTKSHVDSHDTQIAPVNIPRQANTPDPMSCIPKPSWGQELWDTYLRWGKGSIPQELQPPSAHRKQQSLNSTPLQDSMELRKLTATFSPTSWSEIIQQPHEQLQEAVSFWEPSLNLLPVAYASGATGWVTLKSQAVNCNYTHLTFAALQDTPTSVPL